MKQTTEEKAKAYAEKAYYPAPEYGWYESDHEAMTDVLEQAYLAGAAEALASQWKDPEEELPEEKKVVLCFMPDMKDNYAENDSYFDIAILLEGEFINLDAEIIHPTHWMQIPQPSHPDTNTEKNG